jgi:N-acetylneuraminic acid mutarotase
MHSGLTWARLCLGLAALSCFFARFTTVNAQVPVITNPSDEHYLNINSAFDPLDPAAWTPRAPMPTARAGFAISAAGGLIYAIGGAVVDNCTTVSTVEAYDPATDQWITDGLAPMPTPGWRSSAGTLDGTIYVVGGASVEEGECGDALGIVQAYDPSMNSWSDKPPLPTKRIQVGVGVDPANHLLYAVGGADANFTALNTVEVYDPSGNSGMGLWTPLKPLNTPRAFPAVAAIGGKIYAAGGQKELYGTVNTVEEYDPANPDAGWTLKSSVMPLPRLNSAFAVVNDKIYIVGGELQFGSLSTVEIYDPAQNPPDD